MFKRARQSRLIPYDPAELLELPTVKTGAPSFHHRGGESAILAVSERHRAGLWILTLLYTGMRPGETAALTWSDVDFDHNEIHVHAAKESGNRTIKGPKTDSGVRDIPIHAALLPRLLAARGKAILPGVSHEGRDDTKREQHAPHVEQLSDRVDLQLGARQKTGKSWESGRCG